MTDASHLTQDLAAAETTAPPASMMALAEEMLALKTEIDELEALTKDKKARYDAIRKAQLIDAMSEQGITKFAALGKLFFTRNELYANVPAERKEQFHQWLRDTGNGGLITEGVNAQTLKAWARECAENGVALPEYVAVFTEPVIVMKKA